MSPIKDRALYANDWKEISLATKERAGWRCECEGECAIDHAGQNVDGGERRCVEVHGQNAKHFRGAVVLTTAHLDHDPANNDSENLKAMCQRCHNRYDRPHRSKNARKTREAKAGLVPLFAQTAR